MSLVPQETGLRIGLRIGLVGVFQNESTRVCQILNFCFFNCNCIFLLFLRIVFLQMCLHLLLVRDQADGVCIFSFFFCMWLVMIFGHEIDCSSIIKLISDLCLSFLRLL